MFVTASFSELPPNTSLPHFPSRVLFEVYAPCHILITGFRSGCLFRVISFFFWKEISWSLYLNHQLCWTSRVLVPFHLCIGSKYFKLSLFLGGGGVDMRFFLGIDLSLASRKLEVGTYVCLVAFVFSVSLTTNFILGQEFESLVYGGKLSYWEWWWLATWACFE